MEALTFDDDLTGGLEEFANRLESFIAVEHDFVDGALVISLNGNFGSGKTTFLRMWKNRLEKAEEESKSIRVIPLNAWESDYYGDPLFAIISGLVGSLQEEGKAVESLMNAAKDVGWFTTAVASQIAKKATGIDAAAAGALAEKKKGQRERRAEILPDSFSMYKDRMAAMKSLKTAIEKLIGSSKPNVLFLIDELDRCRPDYAISFLEVIKHIFDVEGAVFIIAADRDHLKNSAETAFGQT